MIGEFFEWESPPRVFPLWTRGQDSFSSRVGMRLLTWWTFWQALPNVASSVVMVACVSRQDNLCWHAFTHFEWILASVWCTWHSLACFNDQLSIFSFFGMHLDTWQIWDEVWHALQSCNGQLACVSRLHIWQWKNISVGMRFKSWYVNWHALQHQTRYFFLYLF